MTDMTVKELLSGWEIGRLLGKGSFGEVYEITRKHINGDIERAALKVISIPQSKGDVAELCGYDEESIEAMYEKQLQDIVSEYTTMRKLYSCNNIVNCEDVRYTKKNEGIGWDIFIKMELLTPLTETITGDIPENLVIKLAEDMCVALDVCHNHHILHRDIKLQNIFVSENGDYKLGDFGIAKNVEKTMAGTRIGTYNYMAPEVYANEPYGYSSDIYSLGLVLYRLLNDKRNPFMPPAPEKILYGMEQTALNRRLSGEPLPAPVNGSAQLKRIVLKACAYDPKERYHSAEEMLQDIRKFKASLIVSPEPVDCDEDFPFTGDDTVPLPKRGNEKTVYATPVPPKPEPAGKEMYKKPEPAPITPESADKEMYKKSGPVDPIPGNGKFDDRIDVAPKKKKKPKDRKKPKEKKPKGKKSSNGKITKKLIVALAVAVSVFFVLLVSSGLIIFFDVGNNGIRAKIEDAYNTYLIERHLSENEIDEALELYEELNDSENATDIYYDICFAYAKKCYAEQKYLGALNWIYKIDKSYKDYEAAKIFAMDAAYEYAKQYYNKGNYYNAVELLSTISITYEHYDDVQALMNEAKYNHIKAHYTKNNDLTLKYLYDLINLNYKDAKKLYDELYKWEVKVIFNNSYFDKDTHKTIMDIEDTCYYHIMVNGGPPDGRITLEAKEYCPDGSSSSFDLFDAPFYDGSHMPWILSYKGTGTYKIKVYDDQGNFLAENSVKVY